MSHLADPFVDRGRIPRVMFASRWSRVSIVALACAACGGSYPKNGTGPAHTTTKADPAGPGADPTPGSDDWGDDHTEARAAADKIVADAGKDAKPKKSTPTRQKAEALRNAADLLDKAQDALDSGNKDLAEMLFSSAEILTGSDAIAPLSAAFREGAPPRVTSPTIKVEDKGAQPKTAGSSDEDEPAKAAPAMGALAGSMKIDGKAAAGAIGFVTLEPVGKKWKARAPKQRIMEQRNREFAPHVLAVPVGSTVTFPNFDNIFHNVFSRSDAAMFDLGLYKQGDAREVKFEKEGVVHLGCNLHANMSAFVVVVAAPHYAITDDSGKFTFKNLEPGKYTLKAWSEKSKAPITQQVTVKSGDNTVDVGVTGDAPAGPQPDKFGVTRGGKGW